MTTLVGLDSSTGIDQGHGFGIDNQYFYEDFICSVSGTPTAIYFYSDGQVDTDKYKLAIWNASGVLMGATAELSGQGTAGFHGGAISTAALVSGTHYFLGFIAATNFYHFTDSNVNEIGNVTGSYPTVPATVAAPIDNVSGWGHIAIYVDGTAGGGFIDFCPSHSEDMTDSGDM
jgi:hypothetical protein